MDEICNECEAHILLVFRRARTKFDELIQFFTGEEVHVDIGVFKTPRDNWDENFGVYSAYVGSNLDKTEVHKNFYSEELDKVYVIQTNIQAADKTAEFLEALYKKSTPYNHADLPLCALPQHMCKYIPDTRLEDISSVFCSQLTVLALRVMLQYDCSTSALRNTILSCNSRATSPARLASMLRPFMSRISLRGYLTGSIDRVCV